MTLFELFTRATWAGSVTANLGGFALEGFGYLRPLPNRRLCRACAERGRLRMLEFQRRSRAPSFG